MPVTGGDNRNRYLEGPRGLDSTGWGDLGSPLLPISGAQTVSASFTLDAVLRRSASASFTLDAVVKKTASATFTLDANIVRTTSASFTLDAVLKRTQSASFTLDAVLKATASATFTLDAVISAGGFTGSFTLDAYIQGRVTSSYTLDAILRRGVSATFTLDAILRRTQSATFTLDAFIRPHFTLDAVFFKRTTTHFSLDAQLFKRTTRTFTLDAVIISHRASFTLDAWIRGRSSFTFTLNATIIPTPVPPTERKKAFIKINNVDYANDIIYADAEFTAQVNGQPGTCRFRVRDLQHIYSFTSGQEIRIWIGDTLVWGGYITKAQPGYAFKADDTRNPALTERIWVIEGVDYNILFQRRFLIDVDDPTVSFPLYPVGTHDDVMVRDLIEDSLILSGDNLDPSGIEFVGIANPDLKFNFGNPGDSWGQAMSFIARANGAIFYIDPNRTIYYVDDDALDATLTLSAQPGHLTFTDDFNRTEASDWGTGALGAWNLSAVLSPSVTPGEASGTSFVSWTANVDLPVALYDSADWTGHAIFKWPTTFDTNVSFEMDWADGTFDHDIYTILNRYGAFTFGWNNPDDGNEVNTTLTAPTPGSQWEIEISWSSTDQLLRARAWATSGSVPAYQLELTDVLLVPSDMVVVFLAVTSNNGGIPFNARTWRLNEVEVSGSTESVGYRDMEILNNGTGLINDMLVWGAGTGSINGQVTFARVEDSTSITDHGRWQKGDFRSDLYRQTSVNQRASSFVYGSPQNLRGGKDDAVTIICTVFEPGFTVGQKVRFLNEVFDFDDIFPIRRMRLTFPTPNDPQFELTLTHEVDDPWNTAEFYWPPINFDPPGPIIFDPPPPILPPPGGTCTPEVCGITDDFERTLVNSWGTATCGEVWRTGAFATGGTINVDGDAGTITTNSTTQRTMILGGTGSSSIQVPVDLTVKTMRFQLPGYTTDNANLYEIHWSPTDHPGLVIGPCIGIGGAPGAADSFIDYTSAHFAGAGDIPLSFWSASKTYTWTVWAVSGGGLNQEITDGINTYSPGASGSTPSVAQCTLSFDRGGFAAEQTLRILDIDVPEIDRCTLYQFDTFQRTIADGWGTPSSYATYPWINAGDYSGSSVSSGFAELTGDMLANDGLMIYQGDNGSVADKPFNSTFTMTTSFVYDQDIPVEEELDVVFRIDTNADDHERALSIFLINEPDSSAVYACIFDGMNLYSASGNLPDPPSSGTTIYIIWNSDLSTNTHRVKVWWDGTAPSAWTATLTQSGIPDGAWSRFMIQGQTTYDPVTVSLGPINFLYAGRPCYIDSTSGDPVNGDSIATVGPVCEMATMLSSSVYRLTRTYQADTTRVYLNGILQRRGGLLDYTEDPSNGEVVFTGPEFPEPGDNVYVCYEATGEL